MSNGTAASSFPGTETRMPKQFVYRRSERTFPGHLRHDGWVKAWLSDAENEIHPRLRDVRRRDGWLRGRLLAKQLILTKALAISEVETAISPREIQIHSCDGLGRPTRPRITLRGRLQPWSLSIAHCDGAALVAFSDDPGVMIGVDVVAPLTWSDGFVDLWFTEREQRSLRS